METATPTCLDCGFAFSVRGDSSVIVCHANREYRDAANAATCGQYKPRSDQVTTVTQIWRTSS